MPAGVSLFTYLKFTSAALLSMALGSHVVHLYYNPLAELEELIRKAESKVLSDDIKKVIAETQKPK